MSQEPHNHERHPDEKFQSAVSPQPADAPANQRRRQLLKSGAALVPAMLTLHARPAFASDDDPADSAYGTSR